METKLPEVSTGTPMPPVKTPKVSESRFIELLSVAPTEKQVFDACMFFRHDYGLLDREDRELLAGRAKEWLLCWQKALGA